MFMCVNFHHGGRAIPTKAILSISCTCLCCLNLAKVTNNNADLFHKCNMKSKLITDPLYTLNKPIVTKFIA